MIHRALWVGRWGVDFSFAPDGYDRGRILDCLYDCGASLAVLQRASDLMSGCYMKKASRQGLMYGCGYNQGFTFSNPSLMQSVVVIGPTTNGAEFQNTVVHELFHLATAISASLGIDLLGEEAAYLSGDTMRDLADIVCELGCRRCRH